MHAKQSTQRHSKVIASGVKQYLSNQSLQSTYHDIFFWAITFIISHFGSPQ